MARNITAGIQLNLDDQLSPKIQGAGIAVEDFADKTVGESEKVDKSFTPTVQGAGASAQKFADKADSAAGKVNRSFSSKLRGAGVSLKGFADNAVGAAEKINGAFSGIAGTLGTLGVSIGALSTVKSIIDLDDRMARLGLTANLSEREVNELKRTIFEVAQMPDIKLSTDPIISGLEVILEKTGDIGQIGRENIANLARAIQAAGTEGSPMGDVFSEFAKNKFTAGEITQLMDDIITISDMGEYTFVNFANTAKSVLSSYSLIGNTPEDVKNAVIAMQVLTAGTKSAEVAATALDASMRELTDPTKRKALENLGITVRDNATGEMRDFNDVMVDVAAAYEDFRKADYINSIFGSETQKAIRAYNSEFARNIPRMRELGDTAGTLAEKSETMAHTTKSNLQNLQTAFLSFADINLTGPLQGLMDQLNKLAEDPEKIEDAIRNIAITLGILAGIKIGAGIISIVAGLNSLKSGGGLDASGLANAAGGAGIPVHVTNWGGSGGGLPGLSGPPTASPGGLVDQYGRPLASRPGLPSSPDLPATGGRTQQALAAGKTALKSPKTIAAGVGAGLITAMYEIPEMLDELHDIDRDETLTDRERSEAKGGAIGDASGSIVGATGGAIAGGVLAAMATSALAGTAIGTAIPGLGNILGLVIGAGIGAAGYYFGGKAGRAVGSTIGGAVADGNADKRAERDASLQPPESINNFVTTYSAITPESPGIAPYNIKTNYPWINNTTVTTSASTDDVITTPWGQFRSFPDDYTFALQNPAALIPPGIAAVNNHYQTFQGAPGIVQNNTNTMTTQPVNDLIVTPQGQFSTHPDDYILAMKNPAALITAGIAAVNNHYQTFQGAPGIVQNNTNTMTTQPVNDLIVTPQGQFSTHPDDYILAMKNPAALARAETSFPAEIRNEVQSVERIPPALPPVVVDGEIELHSNLTIDDRGYRLRQAVGKNTTPYKFSVGSAQNARLIP